MQTETGKIATQNPSNKKAGRYSLHNTFNERERKLHNLRTATAGFVQQRFHFLPVGQNETLVIKYGAF